MRKLAEAVWNCEISAEVACLLFIGLFDTLSSAVLFHNGVAVEANPLLRPYVEMGVLPFVMVKLFTFVPAAVFIEAWRARKPLFYRSLVRLACAVYAGVYLVAVGQQIIRA